MGPADTAVIWIGGTALLLAAVAALVVCDLSRRLAKRAASGTCLKVGPAERAEALLRDVLDESEYQQLTKRGYVDLQSPEEAQRIYRIPAYAGLVRMYEHGVAARELCVQPVEPLPSADIIAMHKLMILGNEQEYLARARQYATMQPNLRYRP